MSEISRNHDSLLFMFSRILNGELRREVGWYVECEQGPVFGFKIGIILEDSQDGGREFGFKNDTVQKTGEDSCCVRIHMYKHERNNSVQFEGGFFVGVKNCGVNLVLSDGVGCPEQIMCQRRNLYGVIYL